MSWLNPYRWLLYGGLIAALTLGAWRLDASRQAIGYARAQAEYSRAALKASEAARAKEQDLITKNAKVTHDYIAEKKRGAAAAIVSAGRLREFEATLASIASADTSATGRADDPAIAVSRQCARSLVLLDGYAAGLAGQVRGLQDYAVNVCVTP